MNLISKTIGWFALLFLGVSAVIYLVVPGKEEIYLSFLGVGFFLLILFCIMNRESILTLLRQRQAKYGTNSVVITIIALALLVILNSIVVRHNKRFDLTADALYSISKQTKQVLSNLTTEIVLTGFFQTESGGRGRFEDLIKVYKGHTDKITYTLVDPDKNPRITKQYGITNYGTTVLESGSQETRIREITEEALTNAIVKVIKEDKKKVYFLQGHGEHSLTDNEKDGYAEAKQAVEGEGFLVEELLLVQAGAIPEDASLVVIAGPKKPFLTQEKELIKEYLERGGAAFVMVDPESAPGMNLFLKEWGITVGDNIIIDTVSRMFGGDFTVPVVTEYENHDITKDFSLPTFFPLARTIEHESQGNNIITGEVLLKTSENSWAEIDTTSQKVKFDKGKDTPGPLSLGVVVTKELTRDEQIQEIEKADDEKSGKSKKFSMIVIGDSDFATNYYFHFSGNGDLFLNAVNWLMREESFITIRPKKRQFSPLILTRVQGTIIFLVSLVLIPLMVIGIGVSKWWKRRKL